MCDFPGCIHHRYLLNSHVQYVRKFTCSLAQKYVLVPVCKANFGLVFYLWLLRQASKLPFLTLRFYFSSGYFVMPLNCTLSYALLLLVCMHLWFSHSLFPAMLYHFFLYLPPCLHLPSFTLSLISTSSLYLLIYPLLPIIISLLVISPLHPHILHCHQPLLSNFILSSIPTLTFLSWQNIFLKIKWWLFVVP